MTESFELDKSRREFIATVSHELGTPLTSIKGATETILANPDMPGEVKNHFLDMVISESDRMAHIVHDLLVISRLDNNRMNWTPVSFSVTELIEKCRLVLSSEAEKSAQELGGLDHDDLQKNSLLSHSGFIPVYETGDCVVPSIQFYPAVPIL